MQQIELIKNTENHFVLVLNINNELIISFLDKNVKVELKIEDDITCKLYSTLTKKEIFLVSEQINQGMITRLSQLNEIDVLVNAINTEDQNVESFYEGSFNLTNKKKTEELISITIDVEKNDFKKIDLATNTFEEHMLLNLLNDEQNQFVIMPDHSKNAICIYFDSKYYANLNFNYSFSLLFYSIIDKHEGNLVLGIQQQPKDQNKDMYLTLFSYPRTEQEIKAINTISSNTTIKFIDFKNKKSHSFSIESNQILTSKFHYIFFDKFKPCDDLLITGGMYRIGLNIYLNNHLKYDRLVKSKKLKLIKN